MAIGKIRLIKAAFSHTEYINLLAWLSVMYLKKKKKKTQTASSKKSLWIYLEAASKIFIIFLLRRRQGSRKIGRQDEKDTKWEIVAYWEERRVIKTTGTPLLVNRSFWSLHCELRLLLSSTTMTAGLGPLLFAQKPAFRSTVWGFVYLSLSDDSDELLILFLVLFFQSNTFPQ